MVKKNQFGASPNLFRKRRYYYRLCVLYEIPLFQEINIFKFKIRTPIKLGVLFYIYTFMKKQIERTILHIRDLERRLGEVDNNLRYIKVVQALKKAMDNLYILLLDTALQREYQSTYMVYFYGGSFSFYNKVCSSILEYKNSNGPF